MTVDGEATVTGLRSLKDGTLSVTLQTQELKAEQAGAMFSFTKKVVTSGNTKKTKGQRLRAVVYRTWEQDGGDLDFDTYYDRTMEKIIDLMKQRLD